MREISNIPRSAFTHRRIITSVGLLVSAVIITYSFVSLANGDQSGDILLWLGLIAAITLVIYALKTGKNRMIQYGVIGFGLLLVASGLVTVFIKSLPGNGMPTPLMITGLIAAGMIIIMLGVRMKERTGDIGIQDERSMRIGTYGISYSWYLTFLTIVCIGWLSGLKVISIDGASICLLLIILMPVSGMIFQWYFNMKGDVY
ncbi:MAG TPA: hypothetical protein VN429_02630 [Methanospirillum sp.]|uniref:hypothetical protein n=1 Tax=Methanospirillum sp. TaxID=45200 RepID=UPI002B53986B|nr:hypothetical protein [Methanospirillum sp.]HWQ63285.1 hypothetical protein [Methanospirillum sp.]